MVASYDIDTIRAFELHALSIFSRAEVPLTGVQEYAIDLYKRGFNVFPLPSAYDWNLRGETKKTPYKAEPLYRNRMHYFKDCGCAICIQYNFITLFEGSNIAIMCGATSGNLFAIDCDTHNAFKHIGEELTRRAHEFWSFTSHRGGSYLLRVQEGEIANITKSKFDEVQIWGYRHFVVLPPSIHPKGTSYEWQSPEPLNMLPRDTLQAVSINELNWLGVTLKKNGKVKSSDIEDISGLPEYAKNLSLKSQHTLKYGAIQGERNSMLCALAADLVGIGLDKGGVDTALQTAADNCTPIYDDRDHKIEPILEWAFGKERKPSRKYQRKVSKDVQNWQRAQVFAFSFDWRGDFAGKFSYAKRLFNACIERARLDCRSNVFRATIREIARLAEISKDTASKYLWLLEEHKLISYEGKEASGAFLYKFGDRIIAVQDIYIDLILSENHPTKNNTLPGTDAERDAFYRLGMYAYPIWRNLLVSPAKTAYQIAKRLKLNKDTVGATLKRLVLPGLVSYSQSEGMYYSNTLTEAQFERVALDRGTQNKAKDKLAQFVKEREKYVNRVIGQAKEHHKKESARLKRIEVNLLRTK